MLILRLACGVHRGDEQLGVNTASDEVVGMCSFPYPGGSLPPRPSEGAGNYIEQLGQWSSVYSLQGSDCAPKPQIA